ncbi:hypothetical protein [Massilia scottii]|uniref:hypothetical protein n=1 Tax=Massilia scottii TaxID=3057166 RepID=UPI002796C7C9|nr:MULTISPECIES: hypothetical protein [unclassified Massilia]MDQ1817117.1 hypothetical protein [Massilia sp. CCM 9210]MDQ1833862.1 hypothetical protein [Massilia sp. CCM 9029]
MSNSTSPTPAPSYKIEDVLPAVKKLEKNRLGMVLSGQIKDGKLVLDQATLDEIARKFPNADRAFVAMNSPFDPVSRAI